MDVRRRSPTTTKQQHHHRSSLKQANAGELLKQQPTAYESLPLPLYLTNGLFFTMFFSVMYFLLIRWREKIRNSTPLHVLTISEMAALISLIASFVYLLGFFGIDFVQSVIRPSPDSWTLDDDQTPDQIILNDDKKIPCGISPASPTDLITTSFKKPPPVPAPSTILTGDDEEVVKLVVSGALPSYSLESKLGDCRRAAAIRREALQRITGKSLEGLPLDGFDYDSILGQCCEMPVGYVQIPVGIAGPLLLNGMEYSVPMATTEGCLVASTNRGCKAIYVSGGATSVLLKDGMTRAPVVRFGTAKRAAELKFFLEDPLNFDTLAVLFNK